MTSYNCPNAKREAGKPLLICTKNGKPCLNQRYCPQSKQTVLTAYAKDCPGRTGATDSSAPLGMTKRMLGMTKRMLVMTKGTR